MCVWTKKRGSMNDVVLMATPCPKSLHGKGERWIARNILQGLDSRQPMTAMTWVYFILFFEKRAGDFCGRDQRPILLHPRPLLIRCPRVTGPT